MNKLNKIFFGIIIILVIVIGIITYYCYYLKKSYVGKENIATDTLGIEKEEEEFNPRDIFEVQILEDTLTPLGATLRVTYKELFKNNIIDMNILGYSLEVAKGDTYEKVEPITIDLPNIEMFFNNDTKTFKDQVEIQLDWSKYYGELPKGKYTFNALVYTHNRLISYGSNEFEIK